MELTGRKFISTQFYNLENNEFVEVYPLELSNQILYYVYEKGMDGTFYFHQVEEEKIIDYLEHCHSQNSYNLKLAKNK